MRWRPKPLSHRVPIFMLTYSQLQTIEHLKKYEGFTVPMQIIQWCSSKMKLNKNKRGHGKSYFQEIINYLAQGGKI